MTELLKRTYSGFGYIIVIILGTVLHPYIFAIVFATILFLMLNEFYSMIQKGGMQPQKIPGIISGIFLFALTFLSASGLVSGKYFFLIIPILFSIFIIELFRNKEKPLKNIATTILGLIYVALPVSLINYLVSPGLTGKLDYYPWILMGIFL